MPLISIDPTGHAEEAWKWWLDGGGGSCAGGSIGGGISGSVPLHTGASSVGGALGLGSSIDGKSSLKAGIATVASIAHLLRKGNGNIYTVYFLTDRQHQYDPKGPIYYVGRVKTVNKESRFNYHKNTRNLYPAYWHDGLTYEQARGIEEMGMIGYETLKHEYPYNIIHGISPQNPRRELYLFDGMDYLEHHLEQEALDIYEFYFN